MNNMKNWLRKQMSVEEIEEEHTPTRNQGTLKRQPPQVPFGFINDRWLALKAQAEEGDEWWHFNSGEESWDQLAGTEGYALVRDGEIIDYICTRLN